jgi:predicted house-cleaning noncanonical NTP pyrophosphatase (MazG superfamily)
MLSSERKVYILTELEKNGTVKLKEVCEATGKERIEELADIYELIRTIAELHDSSMENVARLANKKKKERGAFEKKIFLEKVIEE